MLPNVDLVVVFRSSTSPVLSKQQIRDDARKAERQYTNLLDTLSNSGLRAAGRRGEKQGHLLVFVACPKAQLDTLVQRERHSDFLYGLPTSTISSLTSNFSNEPLSPADRLRLIHGYVTSMPADGGLGINPGSPEWDLVESVMALHDHEFNEAWIRTWTTGHVSSTQLDKLRDQFGDAVALYFSFLSSYTRALFVPSIFGLFAHFFLTPYSPIYSIGLLIWSTIFVEWWRVHERILSIRWGTRGSFRVEKRRVQYRTEDKNHQRWWIKDLRMVASVPVILAFAVILAVVLTAIFVFEAFVTHLYTGPGSKVVVSKHLPLPDPVLIYPIQSFTPTILFVALVPRILSAYQSYARRMTAWENHAHQSTYDSSLTLKTFSLSAVVAYLGLGLSAFVYIPFGEHVMGFVQQYLFAGLGRIQEAQETINQTTAMYSSSVAAAQTKVWGGNGVWETDAFNARRKLNPGRLQDQMFAYTVTNQVINTFVEIGLPFVLRFITNKKKTSAAKKKRVVFEDEQRAVGDKDSAMGKEEREFLERVRSEVALPEYELFGDYSEMVTQFGYVALWSTIWPLASAMALLNNILELRSDAFKITVHTRRPIPARADSIGPWLGSLSFLSWLAALTNAALVYLFRSGSVSDGHREGAHAVNGREVLGVAAVVALCASHGYVLLQWVVRRVVERVVWRGSREVGEKEQGEREVKERYLRDIRSSVGAEEKDGERGQEDKGDGGSEVAFWTCDEGLDEIRRGVKDM